MIHDSLQNFARYSKLAPKAWELAAEFIKTVTPTTEKGRYKLDGDMVMADVLYYDTKPLAECKVELHARYIDIQVVLAGKETILSLGTEGLEVLEEFNHERDRGFFVYNGGPATSAPMSDGTFAVYFPGEGHLTAWNDTPTAIRKIVFKVDQSLIRN